MSSGVSLSTLVPSALSQTVPLLLAPHPFALLEVSYRRWQEDARRILNQPYPRSIEMSEEDDDSLLQLNERQNTSRGPT